MKGRDIIQKNQLFKIIAVFFLIFIAVTGLALIFNSQTNLTDSSEPNDIRFHYLSDETDTVSFSEGMNFIYETQLSRVTGVEKWMIPIKIRYEGNPTDEDIGVLNKLIEDFNRVEGFPGMKHINGNADDKENVLLIYAPKESLPEIQEQYNLSEIDRGICLRFSDGREIKHAVVVIESDVDQEYKNSVFLHEMFHMVGFYGHAYDKTSIINRMSEPVPNFSAVDTLALKMLYNPEIPLGMSYPEMNAYYQEKVASEFLT